MWVGLGGILYPNPPVEKKYSLTGCTGTNVSTIYYNRPIIHRDAESYE